MPTKPVIDRRIAKTRLALRDALLSLLAQRGWDELNIQEICDQANVGRSTFYIHYRGKEDLLAEGLNDLRDALKATKPDDAVAHPPLAFMPGLLVHMVEQRQIFKSVIGRRSGHGIERRFRDMVFQLIEHDLARLSLPSLQHQMLARYTAGGVVDIMAWWVDAPEAPKVDVLERLLKEFARAALHAPLIAQHLQSDQNNMSLKS
jgi:AcrR family transcriptional regulator